MAKAREKPNYVIRTQIDANPQPTPKLLRRWKFVDAVSQDLFGRDWKNLKDKQKTAVMDAINAGISVGGRRISKETESLRYTVQ